MEGRADEMNNIELCQCYPAVQPVRLPLGRLLAARSILTTYRFAHARRVCTR